MNYCQFSVDRVYRYTLEHFLVMNAAEPKVVMWIGLNPSTADENQLDPTLRRIRSFTEREGGTSFVMTNIFAFRATDPADMRKADDPIGPANFIALQNIARRSHLIVACWGAHGTYLRQGERVGAMLREMGKKVYCLGTNADGSPKHPLYIHSTTPLQPYIV